MSDDAGSRRRHNIVGGFVWGWTADRFGRPFSAMGFLLAAAAILLYLLGPIDLSLLRFAGLAHSMASASVAFCAAAVIWLFGRETLRRA